MYVIEEKNDVVFAEHKVDFSSNSGQRFFNRTALWALNNGKRVEMELDTVRSRV